MSYRTDSEKVLIIEGDCQEHELRVKLHKFIVEACPGRFWNVFLVLNLCAPLLEIFYALCVSIYRTPNLMRHGIKA